MYFISMLASVCIPGHLADADHRHIYVIICFFEGIFQAKSTETIYDGEHGLNAISDSPDPPDHDTGAADTDCRDGQGWISMQRDIVLTIYCQVGAHTHSSTAVTGE